MGIDSWIFKVTEKRYDGTFTTKIPDKLKQKTHITVEEAQYLVKTKPPYVKTLHMFLLWIINTILKRMRSSELPCPHFTVLFDRWSPDAKKAVQIKRNGQTEAYAYAEDESIIDENDPHGEQEAFKNWDKYTANRDLVRRELYPIIYNALLNDKYYKPKPGEQLIVHGLPVTQIFRRNMAVNWMDQDVIYDQGIPELIPCPRITPDYEKKHPDLYKNVMVIAHGLKYQWNAASNDIGEADLAITQYWRFFPNDDHLIYMNDGDALPILLLHAADRKVNGVFLKDLWLCKPRKGKSEKEKKRLAREKKPPHKWTEKDHRDQKKLQKIVDSYGGTKTWAQIEAERPKEVYININKLYDDILADPKLCDVQNPIVFYVGAILLSGTDYFVGVPGKSFLPGLGVQNKIWPILFNNTKEFSHLFQSSLDVAPDATQWRNIVIDDDAFVHFCHLCYLEANHEDSMENVRKRILATNYSSRVPLSDEQLRACSRNLLFDFLYKQNAGRPGFERFPNIFQKDDQGKSCFGYNEDGTKTTDIGSYPFPVDEVYSKFFYVEQKQERLKRLKK